MSAGCFHTEARVVVVVSAVVDAVAQLVDKGRRRFNDASKFVTAVRFIPRWSQSVTVPKPRHVGRWYQQWRHNNNSNIAAIAVAAQSTAAIGRHEGQPILLVPDHRLIRWFLQSDSGGVKASQEANMLLGFLHQAAGKLHPVMVKNALRRCCWKVVLWPEWCV